jgi:hypothetical protein
MSTLSTEKLAAIETLGDIARWHARAIARHKARQKQEG